MNRYKILTACLFILTASAGHAQLGSSSVGLLSRFGVSVLASDSSGNHKIATAASCSSQCGSVLAVTGLHLEANRQSAGLASLRWYTLTENNSKDFFVQRSYTNAYSYEQTAFVPGKGNSRQKTDYALLDPNTFKGITYYRIAQQDVDGKIAYSNTVSIDGTADSRLFVYPNPASGDNCNLLLPPEYLNTTATVVLYDAAGAIVYQRLYLVSGLSIQLSRLSNLKPGAYLFSVSASERILYGKIALVR